jgi:hypothetical protein
MDLLDVSILFLCEHMGVGGNKDGGAFFLIENISL